METTIVVKEKDIDGLNHVNNSVYLNYLEHAREKWYIEKAGYSYDDFHQANLGTMVLKMEILFKKEAVLHDKLRVITIPEKLGNTSYIFEQKILNEEDEEICSATITKVLTDFTTRKSVKVIDAIARNFK